MTRKESTTDSDSGLFLKGEHEGCFAYSAQTACDRHGFVLDFEVGAGNLHDGQMFHELYKKMNLSKTQIVAVDAGYKTPGVVREIFLSGKKPEVPYTRPKTKDGSFRKSEYVYQKCGVKAPCFSCGDVRCKKKTCLLRIPSGWCNDLCRRYRKPLLARQVLMIAESSAFRRGEFVKFKFFLFHQL